MFERLREIVGAQVDAGECQPAIGMAVATLIDSAVRATIRHNDSEAAASEATTAFVNLEDATRTDRSPKPEMDDRVIGRKSSMKRRITA